MVLVDVFFSNGTIRLDLSQAAIDFYRKQGVRVELVNGGNGGGQTFQDWFTIRQTKVTYSSTNFVRASVTVTLNAFGRQQLQGGTGSTNVYLITAVIDINGIFSINF